MPAYATFFLKIRLTRRESTLRKTPLRLKENYSTIIQKTLPLKFKDPSSFVIPCIIENVAIRKALIDLGANINLMSSMLKKIEGLEVEPTRRTLQLAYRSIKCPYQVVEDVLV